MELAVVRLVFSRGTDSWLLIAIVSVGIVLGVMEGVIVIGARDLCADGDVRVVAIGAEVRAA